MKAVFEVKTEPAYTALIVVAAIIGTCGGAAIVDNIKVATTTTATTIGLALGIKTLKYKWGGKDQHHQRTRTMQDKTQSPEAD